MNTVVCMYRISDASQSDMRKAKLGGGDKMTYLRNFVSVFGSESLYIVADCVCDKTYEQILGIHGCSQRVVRTAYKSAGFSFLHAVLWLLELGLPDDQAAYIVEDDHVHCPASAKLLHEGLCLSEYVTLYDHPDKYDCSVYPRGEETRVFVSESGHWRTTQSTVLTVAARIRTFREDLPTFLHYCQHAYAHDHQMFWDLKLQGRRLVSAIPSMSTHAEIGHVAFFRDWSSMLGNESIGDSAPQIL